MKIKNLIVAALFTVFIAGSYQSSQAQKTIKVMSYNIHYGIGMDKEYDLKRIADVVLDQAPDIVGLQEIGDSTMAATLGELTGMNVVFGPSKGSMKEYGDAVLSKYPFEWIGNLSIPSASSSRYQVMCVDIDLSTVYGAGSKVRFLNTHFDWLSTIGSQEARLATVDVIENGFLANNNLPAILAGDLNAVPQSAPLLKLKEKGWVNIEGGKELHTIPVVNPRKQIDYVLNRPNNKWNCIDIEVIQEQVASDHLPVIVTLELVQEKLHWWGDIDGFYNQQHKVTLDLVNQSLVKYPPALQEPLERKMAMLMLDGVMHEEAAVTRPAVQEYLQTRLRNSIEEIVSSTVKEGAMIWKLYNHGFVIRTSTVTIGFDLVRGNSRASEGFALDNSEIKPLIDACDILLISHRHGDHADLWVAETFLDQGKTVIAPPEVWNREPIHDRIMHLPIDRKSYQEIQLPSGIQISITNYPGHQGASIENNVAIVTSPEGISFAHTGDQSGPAEEWEWLDKIGEYDKVDILFPNCWTPNILRMIKGVSPELVITGHENEMGHSIDHRESNWLSYTRLNGSSKPYILMSWGEAYHYLQKR